LKIRHKVEKANQTTLNRCEFFIFFYIHFETG